MDFKDSKVFVHFQTLGIKESVDSIAKIIESGSSEKHHEFNTNTLELSYLMMLLEKIYENNTDFTVHDPEDGFVTSR